jgi:hypothetical protein
MKKETKKGKSKSPKGGSKVGGPVKDPNKGKKK